MFSLVLKNKRNARKFVITLKRKKVVSSNTMLQAKCEVSVEVTQKRNEPVSLEEEEWADRQNVIGCCLRWVDLQVWYGQRDNIQPTLWSPLTPTGTRILHLTGSCMPRPQLCPRCLTCWTSNHKKPPALHLPPKPCPTPHPSPTPSPSPFIPRYNPLNLSLLLEDSLLCFLTLYDGLIWCSQHNRHIRTQ